MSSTRHVGTIHHNWTAATAIKRKLDDFAAVDGDDDEHEALSPLHNRMRKEQFTAAVASVQAAAPPSPNTPPSSPDRSSSSSSAAESSQKQLHTFTGVQFFVRMIGGSRRTIVIHADPSDTVQKIHEKIELLIGIPVAEQGLVYQGKQLQGEKTLAECDIPSDANLQLVGRMRSTGHPTGWSCIDNMVYQIFNLYKGGNSASHSVKACLIEFLASVPEPDRNPNSFLVESPERNPHTYIKIFLSSSAPAALVMLYMSPVKRNRDCADDCIKCFIESVKGFSKKPFYKQFAPIVLEFCRLLSSGVGNDDPLYNLCRSCLGSIAEYAGICDTEVDMILSTDAATRRVHKKASWGAETSVSQKIKKLSSTEQQILL